MTQTRLHHDSEARDNPEGRRAVTAQQGIVIGFALVEAVGIGWAIAHIVLGFGAR